MAIPNVKQPKVGIVTINWNGFEDTYRCLQSLEACEYQNKIIFVVDNDSADDSVAKLKATSFNIKLIESKANLGWAGGNNLGIKHAQEAGCEAFYLLNNDCRVTPQTISELVACTGELEANWGFLGSTVFDDEAAKLPTFYGATFSSLDGVPIPLSEEGIAFKPSAKAYTSVMAHGCALFTSSETIAAIGLIDERFFLNFDETDWCARARDKGRLVYMSPKSIVYHKASSSIGGWMTPLQQYFMTRNRLLYASKHLPFSALFKCLKTPIWAIKNSLNGAGKLTTLKAFFFGSPDPIVIAIRLGIKDFIFKRFGDCHPNIRRLHTEFKKAQAK